MRNFSCLLFFFRFDFFFILRNPIFQKTAPLRSGASLGFYPKQPISFGITIPRDGCKPIPYLVWSEGKHRADAL